MICVRRAVQPVDAGAGAATRRNNTRTAGYTGSDSKSPGIAPTVPPGMPAAAHRALTQVQDPGFYTFERSAHNPVMEEPQKACRIMREDVLAGTNSHADDPRR